MLATKHPKTPSTGTRKSKVLDVFQDCVERAFKPLEYLCLQGICVSLNVIPSFRGILCLRHMSGLYLKSKAPYQWGVVFVTLFRSTVHASRSVSTSKHKGRSSYFVSNAKSSFCTFCLALSIVSAGCYWPPFNRLSWAWIFEFHIYRLHIGNWALLTMFVWTNAQIFSLPFKTITGVCYGAPLRRSIVQGCTVY